MLHKIVDSINHSSDSSPVNLALDVGIEFLIRDGLGIEPANGMDDLPKLILVIAVFQLIVDVLQISNIQLSLSLHIQEGEVGPSSFLGEWAALHNRKSYNSGCEFLEESFEVQGISSGMIVDLLDEPIDELVFGVKSKCGGGEKNISNIRPSLPWVSI